jgi:DNA (cytosine-5)-methyltransferase 1
MGTNAGMEGVMLTFGSLFAGVGGFDLGFERAGFKCKWQVEIDDYATRILERHWPDVHRERDIRQCGRHNLEPVDCIIGGFPCQDISYAGKGAGLDGARSGLWYEFARIVCELEPRIVCVENVSALLTRGLDQVLGTLASFGFDAEWHCIPAAAVGAPHIRDRVFVLAYRNGQSAFTEHAEVAQLPGGDVADTGRKHGNRRPSIEGQANRQEAEWDQAVDNAERCGEVVDGSDANSNGWNQMEQENERRTSSKRAVGSANERAGRIRKSHWWATKPDVGRVVDGVPSRVDRLRCLGNAIVPQVAEVVARMAMDRLTGGE